MSVPTEQPSSTAPVPAKASGDSRQRMLWPARFYWLLLFAVIVPMALPQIPREVGRWQLAAALNLRSKGEKDAAYDKLANAMKWFPNSPELFLQRAEWRLEDGQRDEALADCDKMLETGKDRVDWLIRHAQLLQEMGEFAQAVDDWKKILEFSQRSGIPSLKLALNGLAYAQALAEVELDDALKYVNESLELTQHDPELEKKPQLLADNVAAVRDTRGLILHLCGDNEAALEDLDNAVKDVDASLRRDIPAATKLGRVPSGFVKAARSYPKTMTGEKQDDAHNVAVFHYHRALILQALGRDDEAQAERATVRQLIGREPDKTLF